MKNQSSPKPDQFLHYVVIATLFMAIAACNGKKFDTVSDTGYVRTTSTKEITCDEVALPWIYFSGESLRKYAEDTYKNKPLYLSNRISNCGVEVNGWFLLQKNSSKYREFDPGPQMLGKPVPDNCGATITLPDGAYLSDITMEKKLIKAITDKGSAWIVLVPQLVTVNNNVFVKWAVWDTEQDPATCGGSASRNPGNSPFMYAYYAGNQFAPLRLETNFGLANPIPPYPAELN